MSIKPIAYLLDTLSGDHSENDRVLKEMSSSIPCIPIPKKKQIDAPKWKQVSLFLFEVVDVVVSCETLTYAAPTAGLRVSTAIEGITSIYHKIFTPEMLGYLGELISPKAFDYLAALMSCGLSTIKELARQSTNNFAYITNQELKDIESTQAGSTVRTLLFNSSIITSGSMIMEA